MKSITQEEWAQICEALRLIPTVSPKTVVERIEKLRHEIYVANETLAAFCSEVDPGRCRLQSTIEILIEEVIDPFFEKETNKP